MQRRQFIVASGLAATAAAGCLGTGSPPPRKSNVVSQISAESGSLQVDLADDSWVMSRYDPPDGRLGSADPADLAPVGAARAKGKGGGGGRGATGRAAGGYSSAPRTGHGRAWWHGGAYAGGWYDDHDDEVHRYDVTVSEVGVAYLGRDFEMQDDAPGAGAVPWDRLFRDPADVVEYPLDRTGWYRVGAHIERARGSHDFRWESIDLKVEDAGGGYEVTKQWKVSPRI